jgi:ribonuclease J
MDSTMRMIYDSPDAEVLPDLAIPPGMLSRDMQYEQLLGILREQTGLSVVNFYEREMVDLVAFQNMAAASGREFLLEPETAYIYWKFTGQKPLVYLPDSADFHAESPRLGWFQEIMTQSSVVSRETIAATPSRYLLQNSYRYILELFDLPREGASYLHAGGLPISDFDPAYKNLLRLIEKAGFRYVSFFSKNYFPHAYPCQVKYYVDQVDAAVLIPSHGYNPERLKAPPGRAQFIPKLGQPYHFNRRRGTLVVVK